MDQLWWSSEHRTRRAARGFNAMVGLRERERAICSAAVGREVAAAAELRTFEIRRRRTPRRRRKFIDIVGSDARPSRPPADVVKLLSTVSRLLSRSTAVPPDWPTVRGGRVANHLRRPEPASLSRRQLPRGDSRSAGQRNARVPGRIAAGPVIAGNVRERFEYTADRGAGQRGGPICANWPNRVPAIAGFGTGRGRRKKRSAPVGLWVGM